MVQGSYGSDLVGTGRTRMANAVKIQKVEKQSTSDAEKKKKIQKGKEKAEDKNLRTPNRRTTRRIETRDLARQRTKKGSRQGSTEVTNDLKPFGDGGEGKRVQLSHEICRARLGPMR